MRSGPQPGYEWQLDLEVTYALDRTGLTVTLRAVNVDAERAPFGVGFHPYLTFGALIDTLHLTVPATRYGTEMAPVAATPWDFTKPHVIGSMQLDTAYGGLIRGGDGRVVARVEDPDGSRRATELWVDETYRYLMVYTADGVGPPERRRKAIAIEPMTCPPDALRSGADLIEMDPGASWRGSWGLQVVQPSAG